MNGKKLLRSVPLRAGLRSVALQAGLRMAESVQTLMLFAVAEYGVTVIGS